LRATGSMIRIKDIVEGEESFFVYANPESMKSFHMEFLLCDKAAAAKQKKEKKEEGDRRSLRVRQRLRSGGGVVAYVGPRPSLTGPPQPPVSPLPPPPQLQPQPSLPTTPRPRPGDHGTASVTEVRQLLELNTESSWTTYVESVKTLRPTCYNLE